MAPRRPAGIVVEPAGPRVETMEPPQNGENAMDGKAGVQPPEGRPPSLLDAVLPVVVMIGLIALTIATFGVGATDGPLQVALMLSAAFASLVALKNGYSTAAIADAAIGGVTTAVGAMFILLSVGALIGTWNMAGTIPTVVDEAVYAAMATGFVSASGVAPVDELFSRGGMAGLLTTVWLVLAAMAFAAILEHAGFLDRLLQPVVMRARTRGRLILAVNSSAIGLNVTAGDQYVADVLPSRMFRNEFRRRGLAPQVLSRAVEDSGTVTSPLVPWNTCGAYMSGVLGVQTASYLPFCFFNLLSPILDVLYGFLGFKVQTIDSTKTPAPEAPAPTATPAHLDSAISGSPT